jgi:hypothetical protein
MERFSHADVKRRSPRKVCGLYNRCVSNRVYETLNEEVDKLGNKNDPIMVFALCGNIPSRHASKTHQGVLS